jgi:hypothetical protein
MTGAFALPRKLIVFGVALPVAAIAGYYLATPDQYNTLAFIGALAAVLMFPLLMRWHHALLIITWNASISVFFLPGQPKLWMLAALISFGIAILNLTMDREHAWIKVPVIQWPLLALLAVVLLTAKLTGGIGVRSLGAASFGGKGYFFIAFAVMGYFALTAQRIPPQRATLLGSLFLLSGITPLVSNLAYAGGSSFYWLFWFFPTDAVTHQVVADYAVGREVIERFSGLTYATVSAATFMMMRYGVNGLLTPSKPWRLLLFGGVVFASLFGGFRSAVLIVGLTFALQFYLEGLFRTRLLLVAALACVLGGAVLVAAADRLPLSVQRAISFLPVEVSPVAKLDAQNSLEWRLQMWRLLLPEVPNYLVRGKGYAINPTDLWLTHESARRGLAKSFEGAIVAGDYHNGPLSVLIPFGLPGAITFLWFLGASVWVLAQNWRHSDPALKSINTFLLAYFMMRIVQFVFVFGSLSSELWFFTGIVGLSVSLNGGVRKAEDQHHAVLAQDARPTAVA